MSLDGAYSWVVKRQIITDAKAIEEDIGTIRADGGTSILPSLEAAYNSLKDSDAKIKHIILLTDGLAERTGYDTLLGNINKDNITVSTVAVGQDSDKALLGRIARVCNGRAYITDAYSNIPSIFTKETFMAARTYLNNREFTPVINYEHTVLKGVAEGGLPTLLGYVGASQKETARVVLKSDEDDPILTVWQYGLGKAVAWNSDVSGRWNSNYITWDKNLKLWQNIINFTVENYDNENASLEITDQGGKATIFLKNKNIDTELNSIATVISPSGESVETKLNPIAPGQYTGTIDIKENGVYMVSSKQDKNGEIVNVVNAGYAAQYSPEYRINTSSNLEKLVSEVGGKIIPEPKEVFSGDIQYKRGQKDLTSYLLALFLILFMIDIAMRRLNLSTNKLRVVWEKISVKASAFKMVQTRNKINNQKRSNTRNQVIDQNINKDINQAGGHIRIKSESHATGKRDLNQNIRSYENIDKLVEVTQETEDVKAELEQNKAKVSENNTLDTSQLLKKKKFKR